MSGASVADALAASGTDSVAAAASKRGLTRPISVRDLLAAIRPTGYVWRGFQHGWEYNHRLNRFGSYVRPARPDEGHDGWVLGHTAASGTGDDIVDFEDYYTGVNAPGVGFAAGTVVLPIDTTKTTPAVVNREVSLQVDTPYLDREQHAVLLNGVDLVAAGDANKLMSLDLRVSEPAVRDDGCLTFDLTCQFTADCNTPECDWDSATDYMLIARYLVVAGDQNGLDVARVSASYEYDWDTEDELEDSIGDRSFTVPDPGAGESGRVTAGFNRVSIDLDRVDEPPIFDIAASHGIPAALDVWPLRLLPEEPDLPINGAAMHLLRWDTAVREVDCGDEECDVGLRLFFKNWREEMYMADYPDCSVLEAAIRGDLSEVDQATLEDFKGDLGELPSSWVALRDAGSAEFEVGVTLLGFRDHAFFRERSRADRLYWAGGGEHAADEAAVTETTLPDPTI